MKIRVTDRTSSKTTDLLTMMRYNPDAVMITHSHKEAQRIVADYSGLDLRKRVVSAEAANNGYFSGRGISKVYVDNLDLILPILLNVNPTQDFIVTATGLRVP